MHRNFNDSLMICAYMEFGEYDLYLKFVFLCYKPNSKTVGTLSNMSINRECNELHTLFNLNVTENSTIAAYVVPKPVCSFQH